MATRPKLALEGLVVVLVGAFNPAIFHPQWFARQNVTFGEQEAETAENVVTTHEVSTFRIGHLRVQVTADRFQVATGNAAAYELVRDLGVGTFRVLRHTPIRIWSDMLEPASTAILTPFARGDVELPKVADKERVLRLAGRAYITSQRARYSPGRLDPVVDDEMEKMTAEQYEVYRRRGHVRLRRSGSQDVMDGWQVDLFGAGEVLRSN